LEGPACFAEPRLNAYKEWLREEIMATGQVGGKIMLCGSGSALAVFFMEESPARLLAESLITGRHQNKGRSRRRLFDSCSAGQADPQIWVTRTLSAEDMVERVTED
jgi:hypothetical protein